MLNKFPVSRNILFFNDQENNPVIIILLSREMGDHAEKNIGC